MKKIFVLLLLNACFFAHAQEDAWVYFTAKTNGQSYFENPLTMLSQRALDRRANQGISLDIKDVPIAQSRIDQIENTAGITVFARSKWLNAVHVRGSILAIRSLENLPIVEYVDFANNALDIAGKMALTKDIQKVDKLLDTQVDFNYGNSANQIEMLNGHLLHEQDFTGSGKIIAVLDAGFPEVDVVQPFARLRTNGQILGGYNFVGRNNNYYSSNSHGTLVLSTMGGFTSGQLVGTAPDASYYLFITEDINSETPLEESLWVEAAEMADSLGVDIINSSLGYFTYDNPNFSYDYADMNGITAFVSRGADIAFSRGMVVVVSAGNSGGSGNPNIGVPADAINVLTIGAVKSDESYAAFSSIGPSADGRVKPDVVAKGQSATLSNTQGDIVTASGTSFSGPIMAGMVASFWQAAPWMSNAQLIQFVKQSADQFSAPDAEKGYGIPDFQSALNMANLAVLSNFKKPFTVWPNPMDNQLFVTLSDEIQSAEMVLYNQLGQKISSHNISRQNETVDVSGLQSGIYFYKIISATKTQSGKLIKN